MRQRLQRFVLPLAALAVLGSYVAVAGCGMFGKALDEISEREKPVQLGERFMEPIRTPGAVGDVWSLPQGWTTATLQDFWNGTQGSEIVPYAYFLHLEQADSQELFRSDAHMRSFRYLPQQPEPSFNPDGLPVGFAKTVDPQSGEVWMGFTCAACHTAQLAYGDREIRIEGGPTLADYRGFQDALNEALAVTAANHDGKFDRFAEALLGADADSTARAALGRDLRVVLRDLRRRAAYNHSDVVDGYGRVDALGQIFNAVTAYDLEIDDNARMPDAPVSYPFLWGTPQSDVVQWNGSVSNKDGGVGRNVGELTGVFGHVDVVPQRGIQNLDGYDSSIQQTSLTRMEVWVEDLWAPAWPEAFLPEIDRSLIAEGESLYAVRCAGCHITETGPEGAEVPYDPRNDDRRYTAQMIPLNAIGTDSTLIHNFTGWLSEDAVATGDLEGSTIGFVTGGRFGERASGLEVLTHVVGGVLLRHKGDTIHQLLTDHEGGLIPGPGQPGVPDSLKFRWYKARPLFGVWATAPYLHNGSVPTLYDLLLPPDQRPDSFWVGNREFDPVNVGYVTTPGDDGVGFLFDTAVPGNGNMGHAGRDYGTDLTHEQRLALIEYIKWLGTE